LKGKNIDFFFQCRDLEVRG